MPDYHNNILCITAEELEQCGLSYGYLKRALAGQRKGEVYCWEHHKEGSKVYIHYNSLKPKYKALIKAILCNGIEPDEFVRRKRKSESEASISQSTDQITNLLDTSADDIELFANSGIYSTIEANQLARGAAWLRLINSIDVKKARKLGFSSIETLRGELFKRCLNEQNSGLVRFSKGIITSERVLLRNAKKYKEQGSSCLIHGGAGNVNRKKTNTLVHAKLTQLASNPVKYSFEDIAMMFNDWADEQGLANLTTSAVKKYLNTPSVKRSWYYKRHGKLAADNDLQPLINREKPSFPDALWSIDGTTMQLYYHENGVIKSDLYVYFITDANTGAIVGYSIAFAETAELVEAALRNAIYTHENKPYQLQYDNSSANVSFAIQNVMSNMSRVHFPCEPRKGRSKYVEGIIGHFQQRVLRKFEFFKGGNITSKSLNSKANPELLESITKNNKVPSRDEVLKAFADAIAEWNSRGEKRDNLGRFVGESKISRYVNTKHEKRVKLNYFDRISLFFVEQRKPYPYGVNGIELEVNGVKRNYIVPDGDGVGDFIFSAQHLGRKFKIKLDRERPDMIALYTDKGKGKDKVFIAHAYNKEKYAACAADLKDGEKAKQVLFKAKQEEFGQEYALKELDRQLSILGELKATGTNGFGWWDTTKTSENNRQSAQEDTANGIGDGLTDKQRRILSIGK